MECTSVKDVEKYLDYYFRGIIKKYGSVKDYLDSLPEIPFKKKDVVVSLPIYQIDLSTLYKGQEFNHLNKIIPQYLDVRLIKTLFSTAKLSNEMLCSARTEILDDILKTTISKLTMQTINYILENNLADKNFIFMLEKKEDKNLDEVKLVIEGWELKGGDESNINVVVHKLKEKIKTILFVLFRRHIYPELKD